MEDDNETFPKGYYRDIIETWSLPQVLGAISIIVGLYLVTVLKILPAYMKNREPYRLKGVLLFYNAFQVLFSFFIVCVFARFLTIEGLFTSKCANKEALENMIASQIYPYFIAKHLDLLDTVFFVLRKKDNQVTFLHLYHHSTMIGWTWLHLMHFPTDHFAFIGLLNCIVHVVMYSYYLISSLGPEYAKYVWWKKHLTKMQLMQFIMVVSHLYYQQQISPCPLPYYFHYYCLTCIISFFFLFLHFYIRSYKTRKSKKEICEEKNGLNNNQYLLKTN